MTLALNLLRRLRTRRLLRRSGIVGGHRARFLTALAPSLENYGRMEFGSDLRVDCFTASVRLHAEPGALLQLGAHVYINSGALLFARQQIRIGNHTRIAENVYICDTHFHPLTPADPVKTAPIEIGKNVWIGRGAVILPGVTIGDHSVVGLGSVVSRDVPARTVVAGVPAREVKRFDCPDDWVRD